MTTPQARSARPVPVTADEHGRFGECGGGLAAAVHCCAGGFRNRENNDRPPTGSPARYPVRRRRRLPPTSEHREESSGVPLEDTDREPWLTAGGRWLHGHDIAGTGGVVACSALKRRYRDILQDATPTAYFLLLTAGREQLIERITHRHGHYMPVSLVDSQLAALEPLHPAERGATLSADADLHTVVEAAAALIRESGWKPAAE
jgi:gluconokinase